jgi:hypothetical protein
MKRSWYIMLTLGVALAASLLMTACTPASPFRTSRVDGPQITVIAPAPNSTTTQGSTVIIRASIKDSNGINVVSLRVNGQAAQTLDLSAQRVTELTQELFWTPELVGTYEIQVDAQNRGGDWGNSAPMVHYVVGPFARETVIAVTLPTIAPTVQQASGGGTPIVTVSPICVPDGKFKCRPCAPSHPSMYPHQCRDSSGLVTDVTVPDGAVFAPGTAFDKTWRLKNTGTCTWNTGYQLAFVGGSQLSAPSTVNMPHEVPPGSTVDVTVRMVAPDASGTYRSDWRMRNPECSNLFGPTIYALIEVRSDTGDLPVITRFEVVPSTISQGQQATLFWEYSNGTSARLDPGDMAIGPTGSLGVTPDATTTYRLVVTNSAGSVERTTTLVVHTGPAPSPPPSSPANLTITGSRPDGFDFTWVDTSNDEQGFRLYDASTRQAVAVFPANVESGAIAGLACGTPHSFYLVSYNDRGESWPSNTVQSSTSPCGG